jgi:hypothetical protein
MRRATIWALGAAAVSMAVWGALAWLAHQPTPWAVALKRELFPWALLEISLAIAVLAIALPRDKKIAAFRVVIVGVTIVLAIGACEASAAFGLIHWKLALERIFGEDAPMAWKYDPDPELGWKRRPNDRWISPSISDIENEFSIPPQRQLMFHFTYDGYGFRNPRTVPRADVVLIGDSYIEGANADDDEVIARRLEARLGSAVESMGVAGYGTLQNLINLDRNAPKLDPRVVVFFFHEGNDLYDDAKIEEMWSLFQADGTSSDLGMARFHSYRQRSFVANLMNYAMRWADPILPNRTPYVGTIKDGPRKGERVMFPGYAAVPWSPWVADRWAVALGAMQKAAALERERGVKTVFVLLSIKERAYWPHVDLAPESGMEGWSFWPIRDDFADFCREHGDACLDLTEPFEEDVAAGNMPFLPTDSHWSARGHELAAELLAPIIRRLLGAD